MRFKRRVQCHWLHFALRPLAAVARCRVGQVFSKYAQMEINVQRSRRDVGADRGERPAPVSQVIR